MNKVLKLKNGSEITVERLWGGTLSSAEQKLKGRSKEDVRGPNATLAMNLKYTVEVLCLVIAEWKDADGNLVEEKTYRDLLMKHDGLRVTLWKAGEDVQMEYDAEMEVELPS